MSINGSGSGAARSVPGGEDRVWRELAELRRSVQQNLAAMRVMVDPLAQALADLEEQQETLAGVVADLASQQDTLSDVVSDLSDAQSDLADLVATQVSTDVGNNTESGFTLTTSFVGHAAVGVTVPAGFTKCAILATASASPYVADPGGDEGSVDMRVDIGGTTGATASSGWLVAGDQRSVSASHARSITGLSGGATVTTQAQLRRNSGSSTDPTVDFLMVSLVAIFTH